MPSVQCWMEKVGIFGLFLVFVGKPLVCHHYIWCKLLILSRYPLSGWWKPLTLLVSWIHFLLNFVWYCPVLFFSCMHWDAYGYACLWLPLISFMEYYMTDFHVLNPCNPDIDTIWSWYINNLLVSGIFSIVFL